MSESKETQLTPIDQSETKPSLVKSNIRDIARMCAKDVDITSALSSHTVDNMKAFLIVYSRSQLNRVVKLTNALSSLEDSLITKTIAQEEIDPEMIMNVIKIIQKSLDSALSLIKQVTTDESYLKVIVNNTEIVQNNLNQYNISSDSFSVLKSKDSRDKVRNAIDTIFSKLGEIEVAEEVSTNGIIEIPPEEE